MNLNAWTYALAGVGLISLPSAVVAEETLKPVTTALSATTLSGYVDTSAQWNLGTGNANVPTYSYGGPGKADGFNLNVVKLVLENPVESESAWGSGYKVDLWLGPDANAIATQSTGLGTGADFAVKQAYVALRAPVGNGLDFKMGVFDTIIGYEVTDAPFNPNHTRSYGYTIEPVAHTGILMSYQFADFLSASVGVANTHHQTINGRAFLGGDTTLDPAEDYGPKAESYKAYMGSLSLTAPEEWGFLAGSVLSAGVVNGFNAAAPDGPGDQTSWYFGATLNTPVTGLKLGAAYDYLDIDDQPLRASAYADVVALYASYQLTEKLTLFGRGEYAASDTTAFLAEEVWSATATLQYDLWKNVLSRLEFRWDHAGDGTEPYGGTVAGGGGKADSFILLANVVYKF